MKMIKKIPDRLYQATMLLALASFALLSVTGCATPGPQHDAATLRQPQDLGLPATTQTTVIADQWWRELGDSALDRLVDQALAQQPSLRVAAARLARAQAGAEAIAGQDKPQLTASAAANRQRYTANGLYPSPIGGHFYNDGTLQLGASWDLDFFGRNHAALQAALGQQRAAQADADAARTVLASQVTRAWLALGRLLSQREVAQRALAQRQSMLDLIGQRVKAGLETNVELRQGEGALPDTRGQIAALDEQIALTRNQLAALTAQPVAALADARPDLSRLTLATVPADLGADLLGRRPDVAAARWRVEAATQDVKAARAQFYPDVRLTAFVGLNALGLDRLVEFGSRTYGAGPALRLPLFDGGRLRANLHGKSADLDAAIEQYNAALLEAVHEAADALTTRQAIEAQRREQAAAQASSEAAYDLALQRYRAGLGSYLTVLNAETQLLTQRRLSVDLQARAFDNQVVLAKSLGGGWQTR